VQPSASQVHKVLTRDAIRESLCRWPALTFTCTVVCGGSVSEKAPPSRPPTPEVRGSRKGGAE
jgi:hypothetical protein